MGVGAPAHDRVELARAVRVQVERIMGGRAHAQFPDNPTKRYFTYRNRGYIINQRGMKKMQLQEVVRFGWFFLLEKKDPKGFYQWLKLLRRGAKEDFRRP